MKDLTPAQQRDMNKLHKGIAEAKAHDTYESWIRSWEDPRWVEKQIEKRFLEDTYNDYLNNICLMDTSHQTLRALERKGYIEVITFSGDTGTRIDKVRVLK
jgi:hypothetical protein